MKELELLKNELDAHPEKKEKLYSYGFIYSDKPININEYPFYTKWKVESIILDGNIVGYLTLHPMTKYKIYVSGNKATIMVGHAVNPFSNICDEGEILEHLNNVPFGEEFYNFLNELTGIFSLLIVENDEIKVFGDAAGIQTTYYGIVDCVRYVGSHIKLLGDVIGLVESEYIKRLVSYKYYPLLGGAIPGDYTNYNEIKRLIPNNFVKMTDKIVVERFFEPHRLVKTNEEIVEEVYKILYSSLDLMSKKWNKPAISLTGGCDSKTTLACANGLYDRFSYFSYVSSEEEKVDADAAKRICDTLNIEHTTYEISDDDNDFDDLQCQKAILFRNSGATRKINPNDVRKRCYFVNVSDFDVEIKSWCSEIGRAYFSKRFNGRKNFGKITPRKCTTLYKFFLHNRRLVRDTDKIFKEYIGRYMNTKDKTNDLIEWQEKFFWEFRMSAWNGNVITGEHKYSFDIAIPYNNRMLFQLLLSASIEDRINDTIYKMIRQKANCEVEKCNISVTNIKHTTKRAKIENIYYVLHSKFPF